MNLKFTKSSRILKRALYQKIQGKGARFRGECLRITYLPSSETSSKLGITVSKKFGKAHDRNLFKRWSREAFRHMQRDLPSGLLVTVYPGVSLEELSLQKIAKDFYSFSLELAHVPSQC